MGRALAVLAVIVPGALLAWLQLNPAANPEIVLPNEHFIVVTIVSMIAFGVAVLVARAAVQLEQRHVLLVALGFMALAGFFSVHALSTPGMLLGAGGAYGSTAGAAAAPYAATAAYGTTSSPYAVATPAAAGYGYSDTPAAAAAHAAHGGWDYGGTIIGLSAFLSLFTAAALFALSFGGLARRVSGGLLFGAVAAMLLLYGAVAAYYPSWLTELPLSRPPWPYLLGAVGVGLFAFSAWRQWHVYRKTRFPMQGALVLAFLLLAEAQVAMVVTGFWTLAWWGYHLLMLAAVMLAISALILELDRRRGLERFLPSEVVERVLAGDALRLAGERRVVTVIFSDLRNSTALEEELPAEEVVGLLNAYVGAMARCVFEQRGMLDKFLGDGLMAVFGIVDGEVDGGANAAVRAALRMREAIDEVNRQWAPRLGGPIGFGVGIHTGEAVLGSIGVPQRSDFTAVGDTPNTAARLQELTKQYGVELVISDSTVARLDGTLTARALGEASVRGRREGVTLYTIDRQGAPTPGPAPALTAS
jgi:class 3 adenylate cyclase